MKKLKLFKKNSQDVFSKTRRRLTIFFSSILSLFFLLFVGLTLLVFHIVIKDEQEQTLRLLSDREVQMAERALYGSGGARREQEKRDLAGNQVFYYITDNSGDLAINQEDYNELRPLYLELVEDWVTEKVEFKRSAITLPEGDPTYKAIPDLDREVLVMARPLYHNGYQIAMMYLAIDNTFYASIIKWIIIVFSSVALLFIFTGYLLSHWMAKRALMPAESAYNQQREFVSNASHELRTPLSVILSAVEALNMEDDKSSPFTGKMLGTLQHEVKRMSKLISELLALARSDTDDAPAELNKESFDAHVLAESVVDAFSKLGSEKQIEIKLDSPDTVWVYGDRDKIAQLMYILADNAIKYTMPGGTVEILIKKAGKKKAEEFFLAVKDTGIGMTEDDQKRIFDRFYRVDKARTRKEGGYGLGLSIAKSIVGAHGGMIQVESIPGQGSTFTVAIPHQQLETADNLQTLHHA